MIYVTPPGACFAEFRVGELAWINQHQEEDPNAMRVPVVSFRNVEENWQLTIVNSNIIMPSQSMDRARDLVALKIVVAAAEIGDVTTVLYLWKLARRGALQEHEELVAISAMEKILPTLEKVHPHGRREASCYLTSIGFLHESRAAWLSGKGYVDASRSQLTLAAQVYHRPAEKTNQFFPSNGLRSQRYNLLGMTLLQLGEREMCKRALFWALTDRFADRAGRVAVLSNMRSLWRHQYLTDEERRQEFGERVKQLRSARKALPVAEPRSFTTAISAILN
jgi:hypothetical protein